MRKASSNLSVPSASELAVYSGVSKLTCTWLCVDHVSVAEEQLGEVGAVLPGDAGDKGCLRHGSSVWVACSVRPGPRHLDRQAGVVPDRRGARRQYEHAVL